MQLGKREPDFNGRLQLPQSWWLEAGEEEVEEEEAYKPQDAAAPSRLERRGEKPKPLDDASGKGIRSSHLLLCSEQLKV